MLDEVSLPTLGFGKYQDPSRPANEVTGESLARTVPPRDRLRLAKAIADGTATVVDLTPMQAALLCRVSPSALCAQHRQPKLKKPLREVWDAASVSERQDLALDVFVLPLAD